VLPQEHWRLWRFWRRRHVISKPSPNEFNNIYLLYDICETVLRDCSSLNSGVAFTKMSALKRRLFTNDGGGLLRLLNIWTRTNTDQRHSSTLFATWWPKKTACRLKIALQWERSSKKNIYLHKQYFHNADGVLPETFGGVDAYAKKLYW